MLCKLTTYPHRGDRPSVRAGAPRGASLPQTLSLLSCNGACFWQPPLLVGGLGTQPCPSQPSPQQQELLKRALDFYRSFHRHQDILWIPPRAGERNASPNCSYRSTLAQGHVSDLPRRCGVGPWAPACSTLFPRPPDGQLLRQPDHLVKPSSSTAGFQCPGWKLKSLENFRTRTFQSILICKALNNKQGILSINYIILLCHH